MYQEFELQEFETNGINVRAAVEGTGPLVIMVHGFPELWYSWRHQIRPIAQAGYRVIAPDVRGYGGSDKPHEVEAYDMETLMKRADLAMYQAKESGRNTYRFHDETMNASAMARTDLENGLRYGLARNEFLLCYQPQLAPRGGDIAGLDAQLYWRHPQHGLLPAAEFVAASEDASVVVPLSEWLMRSVCMQLRAWHASGLPPLYLSVTLPPGAAERGDLPRIVRESTAQAGVDPALLIISLRAPPGGRATARTIDAMQALQDMGARLLLEDLGSGPAAFANLGQYPLSMVRFESGFFRSLARDGDLAAIARAVVSMVHSLNLGVIITDVENSAQVAFVREVGCDLAQGPAYGPPVAAEDVPALLTSLGQRLAAG